MEGWTNGDEGWPDGSLDENEWRDGQMGRGMPDG